jgi:hypothetical protein
LTKYNIGDMFVDTRHKQATRSFILIDIDEDDKDIYYTFYITLDNKEDVFSGKHLEYFVRYHIYIHYPVAK